MGREQILCPLQWSELDTTITIRPMDSPDLKLERRHFTEKALILAVDRDATA